MCTAVVIHVRHTFGTNVTTPPLSYLPQLHLSTAGTLATACTHLILCAEVCFKLYLFGTVKTPQALVMLICIDVAKWIYCVLSVHPAFVARIYTRSYSDYLWRIYHVRSRELRIVLVFASRVYSVWAWIVIYIVQYRGWNRTEMVCAWAERVNFEQAVKFALIGLVIDFILFLVANSFLKKFFYSHLRLRRGMMLLFQSRPLRRMVFVHHGIVIAGFLTHGGYHQGIWILQALLEQAIGADGSDQHGTSNRTNGSRWVNGTCGSY